MRKTPATFDGSTSGFLPIEAGTYPAHVSGISEREVGTKAGPATVFNLTFKIAEEVAEYQQLVFEMDGYEYKLDDNGSKVPVMNGDGEQESRPMTHMVGRDFRDKGHFVFSDSASSGKNRRYFQLLQTFGVELEEEEADGNTIQRLVLLDEEDVVGKPAYVRLSPEKYVTRDTKHLPESEQDWRTAWKVDRVEKWESGKAISPDEVKDDIPF